MKYFIPGRSVLLFLLLTFSLFSQAQQLSGVVKSGDGETIPFASIYIKELTTGTTTNISGEYSLNLSPGTYLISFQALGFARVQEKITMTRVNQVKDIVLKHQDYQIKEVRVFSGNEDPAYPIMRKAISLAPYFLRQVKHYKSNVYLKGGFDMNKVPALFRKQLKEEGIVQGETYVAESVNEIIFNAPNKFEHRQISKRSTIPNDSEEEVLGYLNYSFYDSDNELAVTPLSRKAFSFYKFRYEGFFRQDEYYINKIKVTPKRKNQKLFEGYIYIVDKLWNLHSVDLVNKQFFGKIHIKQVQEQVKGKAWLPVSHQFDVDVKTMGFNVTANYGGSVKYEEVDLNDELPVPTSLKMAYAEMEQEEELQEEASEAVLNKNQQKIEALLQKEDLNNREMVKLSRLMEKENQGMEQMTRGLELESRDSTYKIIKDDRVPADSLDWNKIRPIPLSKKEVESFGLKDSLTLALAGMETDSVNVEEKPKKMVFLGNVLAGKMYYLADSTITFSYKGLLNPNNFGFNSVDGWLLMQNFDVRFYFNNDRKSRLDITPSFKYAINREKFNWNVDTKFHFDHVSHTMFTLYAGQWSKDFNEETGIAPFVNTATSLLLKENYMRLYQDNYIQGRARTDLANGLEFNFIFKYQNIDRLVNNTDYSFGYPKRDYLENNNINGIDASAFDGKKSLYVESKLKYTPKYFYRIDKGKKRMIHSDYPTFTALYRRGLDGVLNTTSHYDLLELSIDQELEWSFMYALNYHLRAGYYFNNSSMHFANYTHFNTHEFPVSFKDWTQNFNLLNDYEKSTNQWYVEGHFNYSTPYLLVKNIPFLQDKLWNENLYFHHLTQANFKNYNEVGYGISQIFLLMNVGVFAGFEELEYKRWGFRLSLDL
jgi:hypothetical protein